MLYMIQLQKNSCWEGQADVPSPRKVSYEIRRG